MSIPLPPLPEPVAWLVEGWHDGKLIAHIPHLTLDDAKASAAVFSQHYTTTKTVPLVAAAPPAAPAPAVPDGMALVPDYRGYAALGTGQYLLDISGDANPAELIIHVATDAEKEGRTVGDLRDKGGPGEVIQPEKMAVRLAFFTVAGLDALEQQLRILRETHFAESAAPAVPATFVVPGFAQWRDGSAAPVVREPQDERAAFEAWIRKDSGDLTTFGSGSNMHYRNSAVNNAWTGWQARAHGIRGGGK